MKSKRIFGFALLIAFALCFSNLAMPKASAISIMLDKLSGVTYYTEDLLEETTLFEVLEGQTTILGGRSVRYRLSENDKGEIVSETAEGVTNAYQEGNWTAVTNGQIEFLHNGIYLIEVTLTSDSTVRQFSVRTRSRCDVSSLSYRNTTELISEYNDAITAEANGTTPLSVGDYFDIPSLEKIIVSDYFYYSDLTLTTYYADADDTAFTSTTSKRFKLTTAGNFSFYVLPTDPCGNALSVEDLVVGPGGWYAKDADDNRTGGVIIPIFTFNVDKNTAPVIEVGTSDDGYLNLEYSVDCFTITASNYNTVYKLYYNSKSFSRNDFESDAAYMSAVLDDDETKDVTEDELDSEALTFTPETKGYYYVALRVVDSNNMATEVLSRAVSVQNEYKVVKVEKEFIKNNVVTVVCACVAILCMIAIIVLFCIKPKEEEVVLEVKSSKKTK